MTQYSGVALLVMWLFGFTTGMAFCLVAHFTSDPPPGQSGDVWVRCPEGWWYYGAIEGRAPAVPVRCVEETSHAPR